VARVQAGMVAEDDVMITLKSGLTRFDGCWVGVEDLRGTYTWEIDYAHRVVEFTFEPIDGTSAKWCIPLDVMCDISVHVKE